MLQFVTRFTGGAIFVFLVHEEDVSSSVMIAILTHKRSI